MARILGIDTGAHTVRGALVRAQFRRIEVERYIEVPLEAAPDPAAQAEARREALRALLAACEKPPDRIVASLDGAEASLRVVSLPAGAAKRATEILPFELESLLPFPTDEAVIDHQPIDQRDGEARLLAAAVPKEKVATRLSELADAGVDPRELAVGAAALDGIVALVPTLATAEPQLVVEIANDATNLCLLVNGRCEMARTLSTGVAQARSGALEAELKRTLVAHRAAGGAAPVRLLLAGDVAVDTNAPGWLEEKMGAPVAQVPLPPAQGAGEGGIGRFARAAALAGRATTRDKRIDLRIGEFAPAQRGGAVARNAKVIALCAATVMLSFMFSIYARWAVLAEENEALTVELARATEEAFGEEAATAAEARVLITRGPRSRDPLPRFDAYDLLAAISEKIPSDITHNTRRLHIELDDDGHGARFELQGRVASVAERDRISSELEGHECVQSITAGRATPGPGNEGLNYTLEGVIRCPGAPAPAENRRRRRGT
jgi:hypothetical protein